jgi:3-hydroxy-9,10-secoandrosta-1,3,5(10)-triene-9,17-dione monooxygenase
MATATLSPTAGIDGDLVARAIALQPLLTGNAEATEANRQVHPDNIAALENAGLFEAILPRRVGGLGATMSTQLAIAAELGAACPSTAWVQTLLSVATWATSRGSGQAQDEIWGGATRPRIFGVLAPTGTAAPVEGGYIVNGAWGFASGGFHGNWAGGGVFVLDPAGNVIAPGMATMRMDEVSLEDTWYVAGMQGTASNTLVAKDVFVPAHRLGIGLDLNDTNGAPAEPSDLWPVGSVLALILAGPLLGAGRAIADIVTAKAPSRAISYTTYFSSDASAVAVTQLAHGRLDIETSWLHAFSAAAYIDAVGAGAERDIAEEARLRGSCGYLTDHLRLGVEKLLNVAGAGAFAKSSPIQRLWRDVNVGSRHAFLATNPSLETYGRSLLGQPPIYMVT